MKYIVFIIMCLCLCTPAKSQTYDELIDKAMDAVEQDSLLQAENYFKEALRLEPANMRNSLLFSNLGTIQRRMGKRKEALESYSLALNKTPFSVTMLLNRSIFTQNGIRIKVTGLDGSLLMGEGVRCV